MPDSTPPLFAADLSSADLLLRTLLDVSLTAVNVLRPLYAATGGPIIDFAIEYLNPAGQRITGLPEQPGIRFLAQYPNAKPEGIFDFYCTAFETGEPGRQSVNYQHDGLNNYFHLSAQRSGQLLVVSFTDTADQPRTAVEQALRESQAREQAARADADYQRERLHSLFMQAPAMICLFEGPEHVFKLVNPPYQSLVGNRPLLDQPIAEAMPELAGQPIFGLLDEVYRTGRSFEAHEMLVQLDHDNSGALGENYYNFIYQATRDQAGAIDGILVFAYEVSTQVRARRQVERSRQQLDELNEELGAANEELQAANEEIRASVADLQLTEQALLELNNDLEARVAARTREAQQARQEAERQRARLERFFRQAPAAICILDGPELVFELVNPNYQALFPGRELEGRAILEAMPEIAGHEVHETLRRVYQTGETHQEPGLLIPMRRAEDGELEDRYFNYIQQARYNEQGQIDGILVFAFEITTQVHDQQRAEALRAEVLAGAQRLARERETFYQVFEQTPAAICIQRGPEHRYDYCNAAYQAFFPGRELLGRTVTEALPETVEAGFKGLLDEVYATGQTYFGSEEPLLLEQPDGRPPKQIYFTFNYQAYRENGVIVGISTFAYDVTEQVRGRQQREAQQAQLRELFEQAPVAICVFRGADYVLEVVNPSMGEMLGHPPAQLLGKPFFEAIPEIDGQGLRELLDEVRRTGTPFVTQEHAVQLARHQSGETGYFNFVYQPLRDETGQQTGITCIAVEVSEQVQSRQTIEATAQRLKLITDSLPVLIGYLDREEKYQFVNQGYEAWFQLKPADLLGRSVREVVGEKAYQGVKTYIDRALTGERLDFEARMPYRNDLTKYIRTSYVPDWQHGQVAGFYTMVADITEQVLARQQVQELNEELAAINEELQATNEELSDTNVQLTRTNVDLDNFIYTASHDLRAPIANIEGLLTALTQQLPEISAHDDQVLTILEMMQGAVERFQKTIDHLTDLTKLQKEQVQPAQTVNLAAIVEEVRLDLTPLLTATQARLDVEVLDCPTISFSQKNLRSVVYNLLSNALKYRAPDRAPQVCLRCRQTERYAVLEVQDNGLGLDAAQQTRLFGMFQRLHDHVEGTGIGLYMVKRMVENAGGHIQVQSEPGSGSTFSVFFPAGHV